jgi:hypothetical protein
LGSNISCCLDNSCCAWNGSVFREHPELSSPIGLFQLLLLALLVLAPTYFPCVAKYVRKQTSRPAAVPGSFW